MHCYLIYIFNNDSLLSRHKKWTNTGKNVLTMYVLLMLCRDFSSLLWSKRTFSILSIIYIPLSFNIDFDLSPRNENCVTSDQCNSSAVVCGLTDQ